MGQDQNYQDKSWLLPALEERLVEFQAAAPCWLLALQGNLPGAVRLSRQSRHSEQSQNLCKPIKARNWATVHDLVMLITPVPDWQPQLSFCLKQNKTIWISPFRMLLALAGGQPADWESWSPTRHPWTAAHMVSHGGGWGHSVQRGWGSFGSSHLEMRRKKGQELQCRTTQRGSQRRQSPRN